MKYFLIALILVGIIGTAFAIGSPPPERVPAASHGVYDLYGNNISRVEVDQQILISADLSNSQEVRQPLVYVVEVYDESGAQIFRGWIEAVIEPKSSFSPHVSWIPQMVGNYTAKMMVLESLQDDSPHLSPPLESEFEVIPAKPKEKTIDKEQFLYIIPQKMFSEKVGNKKIASMHFYKIQKDELAKLPRMDLLLDMLYSFPAENLDNIAVRVNDSILMQYEEFFRQKCLERISADNIVCQTPDMAFEIEEEWHLLEVSGKPDVVLEEATPSWDEDFFQRYQPFSFFDTMETVSENSPDETEWVQPKKQFRDGIPSDEIKCRESLILIQKYDGSPACVKPESISKLIERGWTNS